MTTLDTIKIQIPKELVGNFRGEIFEKTQKGDFLGGNEVVICKAKHDYLPSGISQIQYKEGGEWQVTMSAKILGDDYLQGISVNTYPQAIEKLTQIIEVNPTQLWDNNPKILVCDSTNNIPLDALGGTQLEVCQSLMASKSNDRFINRFYHSTKKLGVEFAGTQLEKNRLICYSKNLDLLKSANKKFMAGVKNPLRLIHESSKQIRVEVNHTSFGAIRQRFGVFENTLQGVLLSNKPVNHDFLCKVTKPTNQLDIFDDIQTSGLMGWEYIQVKGLEWIIKECGGDHVKSKEVFKYLLGDRFKYHYYKKQSKGRLPIKDLIKKVNIENTGELRGRVNEITQRLLNELKVA